MKIYKRYMVFAQAVNKDTFHIWDSQGFDSLHDVKECIEEYYTTYKTRPREVLLSIDGALFEYISPRFRATITIKHWYRFYDKHKIPGYVNIVRSL